MELDNIDLEAHADPKFSLRVSCPHSYTRLHIPITLKAWGWECVPDGWGVHVTSQ